MVLHKAGNDAVGSTGRQRPEVRGRRDELGNGRNIRCIRLPLRRNITQDLRQVFPRDCFSRWSGSRRRVGGLLPPPTLHPEPGSCSDGRRRRRHRRRSRRSRWRRRTFRRVFRLLLLRFVRERGQICLLRGHPFGRREWDLLLGSDFHLSLCVAAIQFIAGDGIHGRRNVRAEEGAVRREEPLPRRIRPRGGQRRRQHPSVAIDGKADRFPRPRARQQRRELPAELPRIGSSEQRIDRVVESSPLFVDTRAHRRRSGLRFLLVKLGGAPFEDDLLLLRAAQRQPPEHEAREEDGEEEDPDALFQKS